MNNKSENYKEALQRIEGARQGDESSLDLSMLNLCDEEFAELLSIINKTLPDLQELDLSGNKLTKLPAEIGELKGLQELNLSDNELINLPDELFNLHELLVLDVAYNKLISFPVKKGKLQKLQELYLYNNKLPQLPDEIGELKKLKKLHLNDNELAEVPITIGELEELEELLLNKNKLTAVPTTLGMLTNIDGLDLTNNLLLPEAIQLLRDFFHEDIVLHDAMDDHDEEFSCLDVLEKLYGADSEAIAIKIKALDPSWEFVNGSTEAEEAEATIALLKKGKKKDPDGSLRQDAERKIKKHTISSTEAIEQFLEEIPLKDDLGTNVMYHEGAKHLLGLVLDDDVPEVEKKSTLYKIAKAVGECATPVKDRLVQAYIDKHTNSDPKPKGYHSLIARQAIENEIVSKLRYMENDDEERILDPDEEIEQVQGLVNSIFMEGASTNPENKCKILFLPQEQPEPLPSITISTDYAFDKVSDELAEEFAKLCCKTYDNGDPIKDDKGNYYFSSQKYRSIIEKYYLDALGIPSPRQTAIDTYREKMESVINENDLQLQYKNANVCSFLNDLGNREQVLRLQLLDVPDSLIQNTVDMYFENQKKEILALAASIKETKNESDTPTYQLSRLSAAIGDRNKRKMGREEGSIRSSNTTDDKTKGSFKRHKC